MRPIGSCSPPFLKISHDRRSRTSLGSSSRSAMRALRRSLTGWNGLPSGVVTRQHTPLDRVLESFVYLFAVDLAVICELVVLRVSGLGLQPDLPRLFHAPDRIVLAAVLENQPRQALAHVTGLQQQIGDARITPIADRMERIAERHDHQSQQEASPRDRKVANEAVE